MPGARPQKSPRHRQKPEPAAQVVGETIKRLRQERKFSFDAFVEETGLGRGYISELERGLVVPTVVTLKRLADALEVTMADLVLGQSTRELVFSATHDLDQQQLDGLLAQVRRLAASNLKKE
jgi:transcriptional regulator with XRE-family HTH domain